MDGNVKNVLNHGYIETMCSSSMLIKNSKKKNYFSHGNSFSSYYNNIV